MRLNHHLSEKNYYNFSQNGNTHPSISEAYVGSLSAFGVAHGGAVG